MGKDVFPMAGEVLPAECSAFEKGVLTRNLRADLSLGCLNIQEDGKRSLCWSVKDSTKRERERKKRGLLCFKDFVAKSFCVFHVIDNE
ncbi:hypothetical protein CDAR_601981 [Caerostris darwini]|uniref:Uncharacterized protein n=1 Tax=Caerostris darwini TaxID=1538125 RepID=A0AAV4SVD9_9ARAC|nr:hypothetical protein CDAR_601981 [Caerostris darwini]